MAPYPFFGYPDDPITLHRYLYANADPVNLSDPTGLSAMMEYSLITAEDSKPETSYSLSRMAREIACVFQKTASILNEVAGILAGLGIYENEKISQVLNTITLVNTCEYDAKAGIKKGSYHPDKRRNIFKDFSTRKRAKDAANRFPGGQKQPKIDKKWPKKPHFHDGDHNNPQKPNIHYGFPL